MNSKIAMVSVVAASFFVGLLIFSFKSIIASTYFEGFPMWSTSVNLSQNEGEALKPWVGSDAARNVHVLWADNTLYPYASHDLFYKMRNPDGLWLSTEVIQKGDFNDFQSKLDHSGTVHVVWTGGTPITLRYMYKPLAGTWSTPITVTTATRVRLPRLKVGPANTLHVMWQLQLNTESAWYIERSPQGTWLTPTLAIPSYSDGISDGIYSCPANFCPSRKG